MVDGSNRGYDPIVIVDAALHHEVDDADQLEALIRDQTIRQAPAGTDADRFILLTAHEQNGVVISNDTYREYRSDFRWLSDRRIPLMIIRGEIEFAAGLPAG